MSDNEEFYQGCRCVNGVRHPDCDKHQLPSLTELKARQEAAEFLKKREEKK